MEKIKLTDLNDQQLEKHTLDLVQKEREIGVLVLLSLREIENRKLYLERGYDSLFAYMTKHLKYSESAASIRLSSLKALKGQKKSQVEQRLKSGKLNFAALSEAKRAFDQLEKENPKITIKDRSELLDKIEGKSKTEREAVFVF